MELKLKPASKNTFPLGAFLIKGAKIEGWILEVQSCSFEPNDCHLYPIPANTPNSIWGCIVVLNVPVKAEMVGKNELCQKVSPQLFIPEKSMVSPRISERDHQLLFGGKLHVFHPDFGLVQLDTSFNLADYIAVPSQQNELWTGPEESNFIPARIKNFQIKTKLDEDPLAELAKKAFPEKEALPMDQLNAWEKVKLSLYKQFLKNEKNLDENNNSNQKIKENLRKKLEALGVSFNGGEGKWLDQLIADFQQLEERNQKELDKFLSMMKKDPANALKYAPPLDTNNSSRGTSDGSFKVGRTWRSTSLFGNAPIGGSGGGAVDLGDGYFELKLQYEQSAKALIEEQKYEQASFIYLKLLKNYKAAARTLIDGKLYKEAAHVYLKNLKDKKGAALAYEKGKLTTKAIELYEELEDFEKVGDLQTTLKNVKHAKIAYQKTVDKHLDLKNHWLAARLIQDKLKDLPAAQRVLLEGWDGSNNRQDCLKMYLDNIPGEEEKKAEFEHLFERKVNTENAAIFLKVVQSEYNKETTNSDFLKSMAYSIISEQAKTNRFSVKELKEFNKTNKGLSADIMRFVKRWKNKND